MVGLASAWGFGVPVVVMVTDALSGNAALITQAFQNAAAIPSCFSERSWCSCGQPSASATAWDPGDRSGAHGDGAGPAYAGVGAHRLRDGSPTWVQRRRPSSTGPWPSRRLTPR